MGDVATSLSWQAQLHIDKRPKPRGKTAPATPIAIARAHGPAAMAE